MKKIILVFTVLLSVFMVSACSINESSNDKVVVVTTLFPQYDMVRSLAGDKVDLILTLPFGVSAHTYEPTPSTIIDILNADLLIYSSDLLEPWVKDFLDANDTGNLRIINLSDYVILIEGIHTNHGHDDNDQHRIDPHY